MSDRTEATPDSDSATSKEIRRSRIRRLVRRLVLGVLLPTVAGIIYYMLWASPQYESVSLITVASGNSDKGDKASSLLLRQYVRSEAMLESLVEQHGFKAHYSGSDTDTWSRLSESAGSREALEYYHSKVRVEYLADSGAVRLVVIAFSGEAAHRFASAIVNASEEVMNRSQERGNNDRFALAESASSKAEAFLNDAQKEVTIQRSNVDAAVPPSIEDLTKLESAQLKRDVALKRYQGALDSLEKINTKLQQEKTYVTLLSGPSVPSDARYPRRLWGVATVFVVSLLLMGVFTMLGAAVREHARF